MEPSFWSWEKASPGGQCFGGFQPAMEPSFWSWEKKPAPPLASAASHPQWSPAFGAGKSGPAHDGWRNRLKARNGAQLLELGKAHPGNQLDPCDRRSAMEPSFWSWEKHKAGRPIEATAAARNGAQLLELGKEVEISPAGARQIPRNGAQLLELGKGSRPRHGPPHDNPAMEPSFWSWEKKIAPLLISHARSMPQWSPAFGAGKSRHPRPRQPASAACRNGAQLLELGKAAQVTCSSCRSSSRNGAQLLELGKVRKPK